MRDRGTKNGPNLHGMLRHLSRYTHFQNLTAMRCLIHASMCQAVHVLTEHYKKRDRLKQSVTLKERKGMIGE